MDNTLSFWGNLASIIGILIVFGGALFKYQKKHQNKLRLKQEALNKSFNEIENLASSASTQGKRLDLFIYKESVLAHARFYVSELRFTAVFRLILISIMFVLYFTAVPTSQTIYNGTVSFIFDMLGSNSNSQPAMIDSNIRYMILGLIGITALFFILYHLISVVLSVISCNRIRRRLVHVSKIFVDTYKSNIGETNAAIFMLDDTILKEPKYSLDETHNEKTT